MSIYETSITNPKKHLEFYKVLSGQLQQENQQLKDRINKAIRKLSSIELTQYELLNLDKDGMSMIKKEDVNKIIKSIKILKGNNNEL